MEAAGSQSANHGDRAFLVSSPTSAEGRHHDSRSNASTTTDRIHLIIADGPRIESKPKIGESGQSVTTMSPEHLEKPNGVSTIQEFRLAALQERLKRAQEVKLPSGL